jgi:hypothetical protein
MNDFTIIMYRAMHNIGRKFRGYFSGACNLAFPNGGALSEAFCPVIFKWHMLAFPQSSLVPPFSTTKIEKVGERGAPSFCGKNFFFYSEKDFFKKLFFS